MYVCMYDVCMCACAQRKAKAKSSKPPERCVIRGESGRQKGTLEEMMQLEHHIRKGCLQQPLPWKELWLDTKVQPKTELQERLGMFDTSRNESRHSKFNQLVDHISSSGVGELPYKAGQSAIVSHKSGAGHRGKNHENTRPEPKTA